jgi:hypothetical protein
VQRKEMLSSPQHTVSLSTLWVQEGESDHSTALSAEIRNVLDVLMLNDANAEHDSPLHAKFI